MLGYSQMWDDGKRELVWSIEYDHHLKITWKRLLMHFDTYLSFVTNDFKWFTIRHCTCIPTPAKTMWYGPQFSKILKNTLNFKIHLMSMDFKILDCSGFFNKYRHKPEVQHVIWQGVVYHRDISSCNLSAFQISLHHPFKENHFFVSGVLEATDSLHHSNEVYDVWGGGYFFP